MFDRDALVCSMLQLIVSDAVGKLRPVEAFSREELKARMRRGATPPLRLVTAEPAPDGPLTHPGGMTNGHVPPVDGR
jgi:hypothetical protein